MAIPVAKLNYSVETATPLSVSFQDLSSNAPASWLWTFGDGENSTSQNPQHTYSASGFFTVTLVATNPDGDSEVLSRRIGVSSIGRTLPLPISDAIDYEIPSSVTTDPDYKDFLIKKWQIFIAPLVTPLVAEANIYNELHYSALANTLIINLVTLELLLHSATLYFMGMGTDGSALVAKVKKVVTGPAESEYFGNADISDGWKDILKTGGLIHALKEKSCMTAEQLDVQIYFCPKFPKPILSPKIYNE